jgi:NAD(P)-dependent dehydrogenase (short-subunit alcohol dehydrogenase family)
MTDRTTPTTTPRATASTSPAPARVALVTGANRGLGRAIAEGLAADGLAVGLLVRDADRAGPAADAVRAAGGAVAVAAADVTSYPAVEAAVAALEAALGPADLLVNNAGVIDPVEVPVWEADPDEWWRVVETDLRGPFHCVRAVVPGMVARGGGRVVDLSSGAGAEDRAIYSAYCAAKAGLMRVAGNLHLAGAVHGVRAFEISPGTVRTDMTAAMAMHAERTDWTDVADLVALVAAAARGDLDAWSGCFLRAGLDTPASLAAAAAGRGPSARRLGIHAYGPGDPVGR